MPPGPKPDIFHSQPRSPDYLTFLTQPDDSLVHVKGILHVTVHQARRVYKGDQAEAFLLGRADLRGQVFHHACQGQSQAKLKASL